MDADEGRAMIEEWDRPGGRTSDPFSDRRGTNCRRCGPTDMGCTTGVPCRSANHDLVGQQGVAVGEIEHGLLRQLLGMISA